MNLIPLRDNVVIKMDKAEETSAGGIFMPETTREKPSEGDVLAVGPGVDMEDGSVKPVVVNVGDKVLFSKYYTPVAVKGMDSVVIMGENNIIAIRKQNENL